MFRSWCNTPTAHQGPTGLLISEKNVHMNQSYDACSAWMATLFVMCMTESMWVCENVSVLEFVFSPFKWLWNTHMKHERMFFGKCLGVWWFAQKHIRWEESAVHSFSKVHMVSVLRLDLQVRLYYNYMHPSVCMCAYLLISNFLTTKLYDN